ncbi:MAG: ubiquinone/menaquinone biosynthesis methyltransferase [Candidatus Acetothermia bacterium]
MIIVNSNSTDNTTSEENFSTSKDRVKQVFSGIAGDYDRVNEFISFGQIGRWRRALLSEIDLKDGQRVLDLGCGTGMLTREIVNSLRIGEVVGVDLSPEMINQGVKEGNCTEDLKVEFKVGDATSLDFATGYFDVVTSAFMLRNVESLTSAVSEMRRVVKPGGRVVTLELAKPKLATFRTIYLSYFNHILPWMGKLLHGRRDPYCHLTTSLKRFPDQDELKQLFERAGLQEVSYKELTFGIAAIHSGVK